MPPINTVPGALATRLLVVAAGLLASGAAQAHYPHDMSYWVAVSPDPAEPRLATSLERIDLDVVARSENGRDWAARLVQATIDGDIVSASFLTPLRLGLATTQRGLQVSEDAGDSFIQEPTISDTGITRVVSSPAILADGLAFASGETHVWRTVDSGETWEAAWETWSGGFTDVDVSPDFGTDGRVCAVEADAISCSHDGGDSWTRSQAPADTFRISVGSGSRVWAIVRDVGLYMSPDDGATWSLVGFADTDLTAIAELPGDLVLLAKSDQAEWRSEDGGATWDTVNVLKVDIDQTKDGVNFFDFSEGPDGAIYMTSWYGLARSDDQGLTYSFYNTEPIENTHWITLTTGEGGALKAWIGTYGGGPLMTDIHTLESQTFPSLIKRFTRSAPASRDWERDGSALFDEGYCTWATADHGHSWQRIAQDENDGGMNMAADIKGVALSPDTTADPFVLAVAGQNAMTFQVSEDLGATWIVGAQEPQCHDLGFMAALSPRWPAESRAWASCGGAVYESVDRGRSWTVLGDTGAWVFEIAEQLDGSVLVGTSDGLWKLDGGTTTQVAFAGQVVDGLATSENEGDDTVFALVPAVGWMRSDDAGVSWVELPAPTGDAPRRVSMSPTYSEDGTVAVAAYGGAWASTDRGESWYSIYASEVYESSHDAWETSGTWDGEYAAEASSAEVTVTTEVGAYKTLQFEGIGVVLEGPATTTPGQLAIWLDGRDAEEVSMPTEGHTIWAAHNLADTWHTLRVQAVLGTVTLDDARITRITPTRDEPGTDSDSAADTGSGRPRPGPDGTTGSTCGCRGSSAQALGLLPIWLLTRRRRRAG